MQCGGTEGKLGNPAGPRFEKCGARQIMIALLLLNITLHHELSHWSQWISLWSKVLLSMSNCISVWLSVIAKLVISLHWCMEWFTLTRKTNSSNKKEQLLLINCSSENLAMEAYYILCSDIYWTPEFSKGILHWLVWQNSSKWLKPYRLGKSICHVP